MRIKGIGYEAFPIPLDFPAEPGGHAGVVAIEFC